MENKIARICWNTERWAKPSGPAGKSKHKFSYEHEKGYGHEEWLFDTTKIINGYHYGFVQGVGAHRNKYLGKLYNLHFYTIDNDTKNKYWVGAINRVEIVDADESIEILKEYKKRGWHREMSNQLERVGGDISYFKNESNPDMFAVIKYKPDDLSILEIPYEFSKSDKAVPSYYYKLQDWFKNPKPIRTRSTARAKNENQRKTNSTRTYKEQIREINLMHNQMQDNIVKHLRKLYGKEKVYPEENIENGTRIDVVRNTRSGDVLYEIKTNITLRQCLREAIGQLLEYSYFSKKPKIAEIIVVSQNSMNEDCLKYLASIRRKHSLPIYYQKFNVDNMQFESGTKY